MENTFLWFNTLSFGPFWVFFPSFPTLISVAFVERTVKWVTVWLSPPKRPFPVRAAKKLSLPQLGLMTLYWAFSQDLAITLPSIIYVISLSLCLSFFCLATSMWFHNNRGEKKKKSMAHRRHTLQTFLKVHTENAHELLCFAGLALCGLHAGVSRVVFEGFFSAWSWLR